MTKGKASRKRGNITMYKEWLNEEKLAQITQWKGQGLSNTELAEMIGVSRPTLYNWIEKYEPIRNAVKEGQKRTVQHIENALMKKVNGHTIRETRRYRTTDKDGNTIERVEIIEKEVSPDTTAIIYALKTKDPENWNEKIRMEHSGRVDSNVNHYANLSEEELRKLAQYGDK
ncbi:helix-turn-helix domain-containing protein [Staphylococcus pseudintermedius]|nr:helix-turn-helix domain-containing protein [Staphylococcus pseudintermedius]